MKTLVTADLHLSDNPRDNYRHAWMEALPDLLVKHGCNRLLILGDLTEEKDRHGAWLVNKIVEHISNLARVCPVYIIRGNHDYVAEEHPYYEFVSKLKNVFWYNLPLCRELRGLGTVLFLPHTRHYERDWQDLDFDDYDWIFAHQTFDGADVGHGKTLEGIPRSVFTRARARGVIAGDIHVPQTILPVVYVGAPYTVDFGDDYKARILLLDGDKMESVPCVGSQKRLVEIRTLADLKKAEKQLGQSDVLKVRVLLDPSEADKWPELQAAVRAWSEDRGYLLHNMQMATDGAANKPTARSINAPRSDTQLVEGYVKLKGAGKPTLKAGLRLMEKV